MVFPIIPIAALAAILGGSGGLAWYFSLPEEKQEEANVKANALAQKMFGKALDELNEEQLGEIVCEIEPK